MFYSLFFIDKFTYNVLRLFNLTKLSEYKIGAAGSGRRLLDSAALPSPVTLGWSGLDVGKTSKWFLKTST